MIWKIIGGFLLAAGALMIFILLTYGGPVFPHILGPAALSVVGASVLWLKKRS